MKKPTPHRKVTEQLGIGAMPGLQQQPVAAQDTSTFQHEQVRLLYNNLPTSIIGSIVLVLSIVIIHPPATNHTLLFVWCALLATVLLIRTALFFARRHHIRTINQIDAGLWLRWYRVTVITTGIIWGAGVIAIFLPLSGDPVQRIYISFVLAGLSAGAATSLAIDRLSTVIFLPSVLVPLIIFLAFEGDTISVVMSVMLILFLIFMLISARQSGIQIVENFSLREKAIQNELQMRLMLESSPIATRIVEKVSNQVVFANSSYVSLIDSTPENVIGTVPSNYYADPEKYEEIMAKISKGEQISNELVELRSHGEHARSKWVLASYFPVMYHDAAANLGWFYDITDRKLTEDQVAHMAYHDTLTGLPNRQLFLDRLSEMIIRADREQNILALMFLDLDKFKPVNDQHGHNIGDLLLKEVAKRILGCLRLSDTTARIGGDEFVILLDSVSTEENALIVAQKIRHALNQPFEIEELNLRISSSIGIALYPNHANTEEALMKRADIAMYYAKSEGRNRVKPYHQGMQNEKTKYVSSQLKD